MPFPAWHTLALGLGWLAALGLLILLLRLELTMGRAPRLTATPLSSEAASATGCLPCADLTVIVPTYNEAANIGGCLAALLASDPAAATWRVIVADDDSSDATAELVETIRSRAGAPAGRLELLLCGPRPAAERWCGKNWPCSEAVRLLPAAVSGTGEAGGDAWLLFLDADVTVGPGALAASLAEARRTGADLLTLAPRLECGCLAEWLVQPIVATLLGLGFPMDRANDPADPTAFAAGPFMLFRRSAYEKIGGHRAVAAEVVEDLALARAIKRQGRRLRYLLGVDLISLRMYRDLEALWEGWTKNWYLGLQRNALLTLASGAVVLLLFSVPWLLLPLAAVQTLRDPWIRPPLLAPALAGVGLQLAIRLWSRWRFGTPLRHWWLAWLGGLLIAAIAPVSIWKTSTGRGWTWRGRSLA